MTSSRQEYILTRTGQVFVVIKKKRIINFLVAILLIVATVGAFIVVCRVAEQAQYLKKLGLSVPCGTKEVFCTDNIGFLGEGHKYSVYRLARKKRNTDLGLIKAGSYRYSKADFEADFNKSLADSRLEIDTKYLPKWNTDYYFGGSGGEQWEASFAYFPETGLLLVILDKR